MALSAGTLDDLAQASGTDRGELSGSSGQPVPSSSSPRFGSWEQWELRAVTTGPGQRRGELRLAAFYSLTRSSVFTSLQTRQEMGSK